MADLILKGAQALTSKQTCRKLSRKKSWLWAGVKADPEFPRPVYLNPGAPVWFEHEVDAWLAKCADRTRKVRGAR